MSSLQDMAPNAKRSLILTIVLVAIAIVVYMFAIVPAKENIEKDRKKLTTLQDRLRKIDLDLNSASNAKKSLDELNNDLKLFHDNKLTRVLDSYSMRARIIIDPIATEMGLTDMNYSEEPFRALPLPRGTLPKQLFTRAVISMTAVGSYQAAVSFLLRLEKEMPLISLQALSITPRQSNQNKQNLNFVFEWPAEGAVTTSKEASKNKGAVKKK